MTVAEKTPPRGRGRPALAPGKAKQRDKPINYYVSPDRRAAIEAAASAAGLSVSAWVDAAAAEKLARG